MAKLRVLVIEDEGLTASLVSGLLVADGYEVRVVNNPESALDRAMQFKADLIISDIDMPKINGFELARAFRKHVALQETPFVLLTSLVTKEVLLTARKLGVRQVLSKRGLDADQLRERLRLVLGVTGEDEPEAGESDPESGAAQATPTGDS